MYPINSCMVQGWAKKLTNLDPAIQVQTLDNLISVTYPDTNRVVRVMWEVSGFKIAFEDEVWDILNEDGAAWIVTCLARGEMLNPPYAAEHQIAIDLGETVCIHSKYGEMGEMGCLYGTLTQVQDGYRCGIHSNNCMKYWYDLLSARREYEESQRLLLEGCWLLDELEIPQDKRDRLAYIVRRLRFFPDPNVKLHFQPPHTELDKRYPDESEWDDTF